MAKPKLIFLHGSGTNAEIFQLQSRKLSALLAPHFDLIYLAAPIERSPGPGVLPFFEGCGPYLTWMDDSSPDTEQAYWEGAGGIVKLVEQVKNEGNDGEVVGIVGFSMGAKVGMEVVRIFEEQAVNGKSDGGVGVNIKIMLCVCGTVPFQAGEVKEGEGEREAYAREKGYQKSLAKEVVKAQSVHLIGYSDPWREESEKLVDFFDENARRVIRFRGGHHMPLEDGMNRQVARMIMAACGSV